MTSARDNHVASVRRWWRPRHITASNWFFHRNLNVAVTLRPLQVYLLPQGETQLRVLLIGRLIGDPWLRDPTCFFSVGGAERS